ncbi:MAG: hypothetical protein EON98_00330 [Chitinophagaceae bacterium]|nr:MAG: hypothetical protein EON98_00330 [Chitinophagaceae bacterium]
MAKEKTTVSDYIRDAINQKNKQTSMNIIDLNKKNFTYPEIDNLHLDLDELFKHPEDLTKEEKRITRMVLDQMGLDPEDDYIIDLRMIPTHLANMIVHIIRMSREKL